MTYQELFNLYRKNIIPDNDGGDDNVEKCKCNLRFNVEFKLSLYIRLVHQITPLDQSQPHFSWALHMATGYPQTVSGPSL